MKCQCLKADMDDCINSHSEDFSGSWDAPIYGSPYCGCRDGRNTGKEVGTRARSSFGGFCVVFLVAAAVGASVYTMMYAHQLERRVERMERLLGQGYRMDNIEYEVTSGDQQSDETTVSSLRYERSATKRHNHSKNQGADTKGHHNGSKKVFLPNFFHLRGRNTSFFEGRSFLWEKGRIISTKGMELVVDHILDAVARVRIKVSGIYMVYSQVAINGTRNREGHRKECAHETVVHTNSTLRVLLQSLVTQHNLGGMIHHDFINQGLHPLDTKLQLGVFALQAKDELSVQYQNGCQHVNFYLSPQYSYFGVVALNI